MHSLFVRGVACVTLIGVLSACSSGKDDDAREDDESTSATSSDTTDVESATPTEVVEVDFGSAQEMIDAAIPLGISCRHPYEPAMIDSRAYSLLTCPSDVTFRVYSSFEDRARDERLFREVAGYAYGTDFEQNSLLLGEENPWLVGASLDKLALLAPEWGGELVDLSNAPPLRDHRRNRRNGGGGGGDLPSVLPGDGTFEVGRDVAPGTYRSEGPADGRNYCFVTVSEEPNDMSTYLRGSSGSGPAIIRLNDGEFVTTSTCRKFVRD